MTSFDYLHSTRPAWLRRALEFHIPERMQAAVLAVVCAIGVSSAACAIERVRLSDALRLEGAYRQKFETSQSAMQKTKVHYARVRALVALDREVREIAASGNVDARTLAAIGNALPARAWLVSITHDRDGIMLEGRAPNFGVIAEVLRSLISAHEFLSPMLVSAQAVSETANRNAIKYVIHMEPARS
jgi:hypothetical protein